MPRIFDEAYFADGLAASTCSPIQAWFCRVLRKAGGLGRILLAAACIIDDGFATAKIFTEQANRENTHGTIRNLMMNMAKCWRLYRRCYSSIVH